MASSPAGSNLTVSAALIAVILATMGALYTADVFLARLEQREVSAEARRRFDSGQAQLRDSRLAEAVESFQHAHSLDREDEQYQLALADAQIRKGDWDAAERNVQEMLDADSNAGEANLLMARILAAKGDFEAAESYFRRAIYGNWPPGADRNRTDARLELVNLLSRSGDSKTLLAELLPLEDASSADPRIARQLPALFLKAGSLQRAEASYRALISRNPHDAEAHAGLARVELEKGNYRGARAAFAEAAHLRPDDSSYSAGEKLAADAADLDPTSRELSSAEKFLRSTKILAIARDAVLSCANERTANLLNSSDKLLASKPPKSFSNEIAEQRLDLAQELWRAIPTSCEKPELLATIMQKLSQ